MFWKAQDIVMSSLRCEVSSKIYDISIVQVKYPSKKDRKMANWMTLINDLILSDTFKFTAQSIINTIKKQIEFHLKQPHCNAIFWKYSRFDFKPRQFTDNLHTKLLMALLPDDCEGIINHI
jgi:hypothetical protein